MNKINTIISLLLVALVLTSCTLAQQQPLRIGFVGALTGEAATYGEDDRNGALLAMEEINAHGGINGRPLDIIFEDGKCNGKDAATAIHKLIETDNVHVVLGASCSSEALAMAPIAETAHVILITSAATNPAIKDAGDFTFRTVPSDALTGKKLADTFSRNFTRIALISENTDFAQGLRTIFTKRATELGLEIVADETYDQGATDYHTQLLKIQEANPQALFIDPQADAAAARILKQLHELDFNPTVGLVYFGSSKSIQDLGPTYTNTLISIDFPEFNSPQALDILSRYEQRFGKKPNYPIWALASYDRVHIIANALRACGEDTECIKTWLYHMSAYPGVTGTIQFDSDGEATRGISHVAYTYHAGKPIVIG